jgi:SSS family solute:Na+ symporter
MMGNTTLILSILIVYLIIMVYLGFYFKNRISSFDDFILGNRGLPWFVISMTMLATLANAQQTLGIAGTSYLMGLSPMIWYFVLVNIFIFPLLVRLGTRYRYLNFSTIVDLGEERYPGSGRITVLLSIWQVAWGIISTAICIFGGALVVETVFGVPLITACAVVTIITVAYCIMGGLNAVVFTDTTQWLIIIAGTAFLIPAVFIKFGTFSSFFSAVLGNSGMTPAEGVNVWPGFSDLFTLPTGVTALGLISMGLAGSLWIPIDLGFMQRMLAAKTTKDGRQAALGFLVIVTLWACIMVIMGMYGTVLHPGVENTDSVILLMANDAMPAIGVAIFITAIAAAIMSTVSTYLNAAAAILTKNIYLRFFNNNATDKQLIKMTQIFIAIVALAALCFAPVVRNSGVFMTAITAQMVMCASLTPLILLSTYWKRMTEPAAFWGCVISGIITLIIVFRSGGGNAVFFGAGIAGIPAIFIGLALSVGIYVIMSLSATYNPANVGPAFLEIFEKTKEAEKTSNKDIAIIGTAVALLLIAIGVKRSSVTPSSWPPLSGIGGMLTDWFFILDGIVILVICVFILVRTIRWAQGLKKAQAAKSVSVNKTEFK